MFNQCQLDLISNMFLQNASIAGSLILKTISIIVLHMMLNVIFVIGTVLYLPLTWFLNHCVKYSLTDLIFSLILFFSFWKGMRPQFYLDHLKVGFAYKINRFHVVRNKISSKVVHHATIVELNKKTTIVLVDKTSQEIPMQQFN